jgi:hypothetical protein
MVCRVVGKTMKTTRTWLWLVGVLVVVLSVRLAIPQQPKSKNEGRSDAQLPGLMLAKLANTQRIIAGLVSKDFGEIKQGAEHMVRVCEADVWESNPDPIYSQYRSELRRQALKLSGLADAHNLDGSAFCYVQVVSTCISCHEHCRDVLRIAQIPNAGNRVISIPTSEQDERWNGMPMLRR